MASESAAMFDEKWAKLDARLEIVPGKRVLKELRAWLLEEYGITMTDFQILDAYRAEDIPPDMARLIARLDEFRAQH